MPTFTLQHLWFLSLTFLVNTFVNTIFVNTFVNSAVSFVNAATTDDVTWVTFALQTQRDLIGDFTIDKAPLVGTHNSYSSAHYHSILQNQNLSLTEQFEIGVRYVELDLHFVPEFNDTDQGPFRICHASTAVSWACLRFGWSNCTANGIMNYGEDTGCLSSTPNYTQIFEEISTWLQKNSDAVIVINFDDAISGADVNAASNMIDLVNSWLEQYFGDIIFTPEDLIQNGNAWPTINELNSKKKNLIINTNGHDFGGIYVHADLRGYVWPQSKISYFSGFPSCTSTSHTGNNSVHFAFFQEDRLLFTYNGSPFYDGSLDVGTFTASSSLAVMQCEYTTFYDFFSAESAANLVWSWDREQPMNNAKCASINTDTGRWVAEDCGNSHLFACRSNMNNSEWKISEEESSRLKYDEEICPSGYSFSSPRTARENFELLQVVSGENVWISMNKDEDGTWSSVPTKAPEGKKKRHELQTTAKVLVGIVAAIATVGFFVGVGFAVKRRMDRRKKSQNMSFEPMDDL